MLSEIFDINHRSNNYSEKAFCILKSSNYELILKRNHFEELNVENILQDLYLCIESFRLGKDWINAINICKIIENYYLNNQFKWDSYEKLSEIYVKKKFNFFFIFSFF